MFPQSDEISDDIKPTTKHPQDKVYPNDSPAVMLPCEQRPDNGAVLESTSSGTRKRLHKEKDHLQGGYEISVCDSTSIYSVPSMLSLYSRVEDVSDSRKDLDTPAVLPYI